MLRRTIAEASPLELGRQPNVTRSWWPGTSVARTRRVKSQTRNARERIFEEARRAASSHPAPDPDMPRRPAPKRSLLLDDAERRHAAFHAGAWNEESLVVNCGSSPRVAGVRSSEIRPRRKG